MTTHNNSVQCVFSGPRMLQDSLKDLFPLFSNKISQYSKHGNEVYNFT